MPDFFSGTAGVPSGSAGGDLTGTYPNPTLAAIGSASGPVGSATASAAVTIDAKGRVTTLTSVPITGTAPGGAAAGDLSGTYPNPLLAHYRTILRTVKKAGASTIALSGTYVGQPNGVIAAASGGTPEMMYLDPASYTSSGFTAKLNLQVACAVGDTAPANTMTFGLYPISAITTNTPTVTLGTVTSGSTCAITTPSANSLGSPVNSGDFTFPTAGWYIIGVAADAAFAATSLSMYSIHLRVRNV